MLYETGLTGRHADPYRAQYEGAISTKKKVKILLVDDTPDNLVSLGAALDILGEELVFAHSGREALRHLLDDDFAAILLDVKMPEMDGFETAELIRSRLKSRYTPILFLTGFKNEEHLFRGYDLGAVDYLFKPIVPEVLRSKVAVFVELSRRADQLQEQAKLLTAQAATLQRAEHRFRRLLEAAPDAMVTTAQTSMRGPISSLRPTAAALKEGRRRLPNLAKASTSLRAAH